MTSIYFKSLILFHKNRQKEKRWFLLLKLNHDEYGSKCAHTYACTHTRAHVYAHKNTRDVSTSHDKHLDSIIKQFFASERYQCTESQHTLNANNSDCVYILYYYACVWQNNRNLTPLHLPSSPKSTTGRKNRKQDDLHLLIKVARARVRACLRACVRACVCVFFLASEDFGRMFDHLFPACAFFFKSGD